MNYEMNYIVQTKNSVHALYLAIVNIKMYV